MSLTDDIFMAHHAPKKILQKHFVTPVNEMMTLALAFTFGIIVFCALLPALKTASLQDNIPFIAMILPAAFATFGLLPICLIIIGSLQAILLKAIGLKGRIDFGRRGFIWALIVSSPWILLSAAASAYSFYNIHIVFSFIAFMIFSWHYIISIYVNHTLSKYNFLS